MPLQATSGAASYDAFGGGVAVVPNYIEEVFSCFLYTGNGSTQTITNGIDFSTKGGLVWMKSRTSNPSYEFNVLMDTARPSGGLLQSNSTNAQSGGTLTTYNTNGFTINAGYTAWNSFGQNYVSWSFAKAPKFFDVVTWTGNGTAGRAIPHNLGSVPGCIIVKRTSNAANWVVYHRSTGNTKYLCLNATFMADNDVDYWYSTTPTSTNFTVNSYDNVNGSGYTYVAYLFAHNAGGFGLTGTDNVISCGSVTADGSGNATVNLGYEPQWILIKSSSEANGWAIVDTMRGLPAEGLDRYLLANSSAAEAGGGIVNINATGFYANATLSASATYIYIAIRRGPMKVPTDATKVFAPITRTGTGATATVTGTGFPIDLLFSQGRSAGFGNVAWDRLRGVSPYLGTFNTNNEANSANSILSYDMDGITVGADTGSFQVNQSTKNYIYWMMRRAPSFFDEVCYTGNGVTQIRSISHNLGVIPELIICKSRSSSTNWVVSFGNDRAVWLNSTNADTGNSNLTGTYANGLFLPASSSATATLTYGGATDAAAVNASGVTYVAYLFATCAGVSKVGSYTGTGATQTINCGFGASGSRFVLVKRTNSTGDWYVWDSARGMVSGTDPSLLLNSTAAEVNANSVYAVSTGFQIVSTAAGINASGGSYIFLSVA
jgi:hypothetical protein